MHKIKWIEANAMKYSCTTGKKAKVENQKKIPVLWEKHRAETEVGAWETMRCYRSTFWQTLIMQGRKHHSKEWTAEATVHFCETEGWTLSKFSVFAILIANHVKDEQRGWQRLYFYDNLFTIWRNKYTIGVSHAYVHTVK